MTDLAHGLAPKMKPISRKRSAIVCALDVGTSKIVCAIARLKPRPPQDVLPRRTHSVEVIGIGHAQAQGMPRIDELPIPAQNQIRAKQAETAAAPEKPRQSLLQRLASVGLGRREDDAPAQAPAPVVQRVSPPMPKAPPMPPLAQQTARPEGVSDYAKRPVVQRPAPQGLDHHGRPAPVHNSVEEDQLEIPAFLRRQAN